MVFATYKELMDHLKSVYHLTTVERVPAGVFIYFFKIINDPVTSREPVTITKSAPFEGHGGTGNVRYVNVTRGKSFVMIEIEGYSNMYFIGDNPLNPLS